MQGTEYQEFLDKKEIKATSQGKEPSAIHAQLFDFQADIVKWSVRKGRAAIFADVGLGKTIQQGEWARQMNEPTLFIAPLGVAQQTSRDLKTLLDMDVHYVRSQDQVDFTSSQFFITNYEMIDHFKPKQFNAVVLDESSNLKDVSSKTRIKLTKMFSKTAYRLCCTATPSPNDIAEIGNHAEFLGIMSQAQMLATFFVHDSQLRNGAWRLKKHAEVPFYRWLASWAVAIRKPSDIGYSDDGFTKPNINIELLTVDTSYTPPGMLPGFEVQAVSAIEAKKLRRETIEDRAIMIADEINQDKEQRIIWTELNKEGEVLESMIPDSLNVHGGMSIDQKIDAIMRFVSGDLRVLITKTSICGMGLNLQNAGKMDFFGINYSYEQFYQAIGRIARFGQSRKEVHVRVIISSQELSVYQTVQAKQEEAMKMQSKLIEQMELYTEVGHKHTESDFVYREDKASGNGWDLLLGDSAKRMAEIEDNSIDLSIYSPPFDDVFVFSNSEHDLSNNPSFDQFMEHYGFFIRENLRITKPGRLACVHLTELRTFKGRDGFRGLIDFTGAVIKAYQDAGWIWRSRITIDKNPESVAIRTKDSDLQFASLVKDSTKSCPMNPDYLMVFQKEGDNEVPVTPVVNGEVTRDEWKLWARAIWYDISETDTLNVRIAKGNNDEKHMSPTQLMLLDRCIKLWSNPDELVFSPFAGVGSELYQALILKRRALGIELKEEYWTTACHYLANAELLRGRTLFDLMEDS